MKRSIEAHPLSGYQPFSIQVTLPGVLRRIVTGFDEPSPILQPGKAPVAEMRPIPVLMFEADPDQDKVLRSYVWLPPNGVLEHPGCLEYVDSYVDEVSGQPLFLYEVVA